MWIIAKKYRYRGLQFLDLIQERAWRWVVYFLALAFAFRRAQYAFILVLTAFRCADDMRRRPLCSAAFEVA